MIQMFKMQDLWNSLTVVVGAAVLMPAAAQAAPKGAYVNTASSVARTFVGDVYSQAGAKACGNACGVAAKATGQAIYDAGQRFTTTYGPKLEDVGRQLGTQMNVTCGGSSGIAGTTPQACLPKRR